MYRTRGIWGVAAVLAVALLSGFTSTVLKTDGNPYEGITVTAEDYWDGTVLGTALTDAQGQYTLPLTGSLDRFIKLTFRTSSGISVQNEISVPAAALSEGFIRQGSLDSLAMVSSAVRGGQVWGHTIKRQRDLVPPLTFRFDDFGAGGDDRYTGDNSWEDMILSCMDYGFIPAIATNAYYINRGGADADSLCVIAIGRKADETGIRPEWLMHTNSNMNVLGYGGAGWNYDAVNEHYVWDSFYEWSLEDWKKELDPEAIRTRINAILDTTDDVVYRIGEGEIVGMVWPGDGQPQRRAFQRRNQSMLAQVFAEVGLEYGVDGYTTTVDSIPSLKLSHFWSSVDADRTMYNGGPVYAAGLYSGENVNRVQLPMPITSDLGNRRVERGAQNKVPWAPASTFEWTLAQNTNYGDSYPPSTYTEATVANFTSTVRNDYMWAVALNAHHGFVMHPRGEATMGAQDTYTYGNGPGTQNDDLVIGESVNGGANTHTDPFDWEYIFALSRELIDAGFFRNTTYTEAVRWLASTPGAPGLRVRGFDDPVNPAIAIGDTVGVLPESIIMGSGSQGILAAYAGIFGTRWIASQADYDWDGKWDTFGLADNTWTDSVDPTEETYLAAGHGDGADPNLVYQPNNALMQWDDQGLNCPLWFGYDQLPPGRYQFETTWQGAGRIDYTNVEPRLFMQGMIEHAGGGDGYGRGDYEVLVVHEAWLGADADSWTPHAPATGRLGSRGLGNDTWPGAEPQTRQAGWYRHSVTFTVPRTPKSSEWDPENTPAHAQVRLWRGSFQFRISPLAADYNGGPGLEEHPRLGSARLIWLGEE